MHATCPTCGGTIDPATELRVDLVGNIAVSGNRSVGLKAREAEVLAVLLERKPAYMQAVEIADRVWALTDDIVDAPNAARQACWGLARKLPHIGWTVAGKPGIGYRVEALP